LGERGLVYDPVSLLFVQLQNRIAVQILSAFILVAWDLWSTPRFATRSDRRSGRVRSSDW
jgi:hypothetical protein